MVHFKGFTTPSRRLYHSICINNPHCSSPKSQIYHGKNYGRLISTFVNGHGSLIPSLQTKLKNTNLPELYPLKELVELYSNEYDAELFDLVEKELLNLYYDCYTVVENLNDPKFFKLRSELKQLHSKLHCGSMHSVMGYDKVILEVIPGVGGEESARFADELFSMYKNISLDRELDVIERGNRVAEVTGDVEFFKYEFGVHRVQRIPLNCKRVQTSSAVVTVVPHKIIENAQIRNSDVIIETMRSSGPGGQSVNKSETAVRVIHVPSGITVSVRDTSSQIDNKSKAFALIGQKIKERNNEALERLKCETKASQYKTGDRSEKIRTFNFIHDTVTDHRAKISFNGAQQFLEGGDGIDKIHRALESLDNRNIINFMIDNMQGLTELYTTHRLGTRQHSKSIMN